MNKADFVSISWREIGDNILNRRFTSDDMIVSFDVINNEIGEKVLPSDTEYEDDFSILDTDIKSDLFDVLEKHFPEYLI